MKPTPASQLRPAKALLLMASFTLLLRVPGTRALNPDFWSGFAAKSPQERKLALIEALRADLTTQEQGTARVALGRLYELDGQTAAALQCYSDEAVRASEIREYAAYWNAQLKIQQGREAEAVPLWQDLFAETPQPSFKLDAARALSDRELKAGRKREAIPYVEALYASAPADAITAALLADLYEGTGKKDLAQPLAVSLWTESPAHEASISYFRTHAGWAEALKGMPNPLKLTRLKNLAQAGDLKALGRELPGFKPESSEEQAWTLFLRGRLAEGRGRALEAVTTYRSVKAPEEVALLCGERMGLAASRGGLPPKTAASVEEAVMALPGSFAGREKALLALMRWRDRSGLEGRACELAAGLLAAGAPQSQASEYLYRTAWTNWLLGKRAEAVKLWRVLLTSLPAGSDDRLSAAYTLLRLERLSPEEAQSAREEMLREDRYGYYGYQIRKGLPRPQGSPLPPLSEPPAPEGSHTAKARTLLLVGFPAEAVSEYRLASAGQKDLRLDWAMADAQEALGDYAGAIRSVRRVYPRAYNTSGDSLPDAAWKRIYPLPYREELSLSASEHQIPLLFAASVVRQESLWDRSAVSRAGAVGLMQLMPATAKAVAHRLGLPPPTTGRYFDPAWNTQAGCGYLAQVMAQYQGRAYLALAAYNAGPGRVREWLNRPGAPKEPDLFSESIPLRETRSYIRRIFLNYWEYGRLYPDLRQPGALPELELAQDR